MDSLSPDYCQDSHLLFKMSEGCQHSFKALYEKYWESAYSEAFKRLKHTDQAKDVVQEIFAQIWFKRATVTIENLPAYLHIAVRNRVLKQLSRQKPTHPFFNILEDLPALHQQADEDILAKEFFKTYALLVASLPLKKQRIFKMRYEDDLSTKDIALQLGISRKTVQNQLTTAVEYLRAALFIFLILFLSQR